MTIPEQNQNPDFKTQGSSRGASDGGDGLDPLPPEFEAPLHSLDARLGDAARRIETPVGLEDRVYSASVGLLPGRIRRATSPAVRGPARLRLFTFRGVNFPAVSFGGRLALAASLGLAFVLAAWFLNQPGPVGPADSSGLARSSGEPGSSDLAPPADATTYVAFDLVSRDMGWLADEPFEDMDRAVAYLLDTSLLTMADLAGEMGSIVAPSEM